ncbi:septum formation initiator family protein [Isoptericola halotolerans]|uniref:FtsB family cell division protein n=1 Tax=Isoptericola halotolerans TaxID=300560 RepID=UPI003890F384
MPSRRPTTPRRPTSRPGARTPSRPAPTARSRATGASRTTSTKRGSARRPAGPSRDDRRRSRLGLVLPEVLTVRLLVLSVVVLLAFVLLLPTVRGAVQQRAEIDRLQAELTAYEAERTELENELGRWEDRSYVVEQARTRLNYVMPGDTVWRVIDGDEVTDGDAPAKDEAATEPVSPAGPAGAPWYQALWESVQVSDDAATHMHGESVEGDESDGTDGGPGGADGGE